jgi:hypothetical protein
LNLPPGAIQSIFDPDILNCPPNERQDRYLLIYCS